MGKATTGTARVLAVVAIAAAAAGAGWWAGSSSQRAAPGDAGGYSGPAVSSAAPSPDKSTPTPSSPPPETKPADPAAPMVPLRCEARQFNGTLALAVSFTQPLSRTSDLQQWISVSDAGKVERDDSESEETGSESDETVSAAAGTDALTGSLPAKLRNTGQAIGGRWIVGDDARVAYFPYAGSQRRYVIQFQPGLPGADAAKVQQDAAYCDLSTQSVASSFYFASKGVVLPAGQNGGLPVATVNVPEVDVQFLRVDPSRVPEFFDNALRIPAPKTEATASEDSTTPADGEDSDNEHEYDEESWDNSSGKLQGLVGMWDLDRLRRLSTSVFQGRFLTDNAVNTRQVTFLPVEQIEALKSPGIYIAVMTQPGRFQYESQVTYFYVSDIGLHARRYPDAVEAFSVSLTSGKAQSGTRIDLLDAVGKVLATARTDDQGKARLEGAPAAARVLRATRGQEMTVLALGEPALDLSEFDVGGLPNSSRKLFVYAGRNLYRPGETFNVSVLGRDMDGKLADQPPLTATIKRADGRTVRTALWQVRADTPGYTQQQIELPADAQTGTWRLELRADPAQKRADAVWTFEVEEFLPERMKLVLKAQGQPTAGESSMTVDVQGDYLYGAPASGNRLLAAVQTRRARVALPEKWPGFIFGDVADDDRKAYRELEESTLDAKGQGELTFDPELEGTKSPMSVRILASLLESGGRPVVRSLEQTVWPVDTMIAVRPLFDRDVTQEGRPAAFEAVRVDRQGNIVPLSKATLRLVKENRRYYWRYDDQRGWNSGYTESEEQVETRQIDLRDRLSFNLPTKWGRYRVDIEDPETGQTLRYRFYAGWDAQDAETMGNRPDRVQMQVSGTPAHPGDTVKLTVTPPHDGQALIAVEGGGGLLWSTWASVKATGTEVDIPLDQAWKRNDLYISAVVFRPGSDGDRVTPARAVGLSYLPMDNAARKWDVTLDAPAKVQPEQTVRARVKVAGAEGKAVHVTVSAVDVGILNINNYPTPDPFAFFFGKHRYAPELLDMYGKLIEKMAGKQGRLRWGGDADRRGDSRSLPKKVKLVDIFSGVVNVDATGQADIDLPIPDFNGTLRLMAVAFDDTRYGHAERDMQVAAPIVAELSTPRFITPGDQAAIALDVTNMSGQARRIDIDLRADAPLAISDGRRTIELADKQRTILRFTATGTGTYGPGLVSLGIDAPAGQTPGAPPLPAYKAVRESILQVQPAYPPQRRVEQVRIAPGASFDVPAQWTEGLLPDTTTVSLSAASQLPFDVPRLVHGLLTYPYGCTEQTISAAFPWLLVDEASAKQFRIKGDLKTQRQAKVNGALGRLAGMRSSSGGYNLWGGPSSERDVWLTAYATSFLQSARDNGFAVPAHDIDSSQQWMLTSVQRARSGFGQWSAALKRAVQQGTVDSSQVSVLRDDHRRFAGLAAASWVLARDRKAPLSTLRMLFDDYSDRARSPLPLVHLAVAFKLMGDGPRADKAAALALSRDYGLSRANGRSDEWLGDYGSAVRDLALSYTLLTQNDLAADRRESLLTLLASSLSGRSYFSTQEQWALLQAAQTAGASSKPWRVQWAVAGKRGTLQGGDTQSVSLPSIPPVNPRIDNVGDTPVFLSFDVQGTAAQPPRADRRVIDLQRTWYRPDGKTWDGGVLRTGDILVARLTAKSSVAMPDGLIVDQVPAGLEVENLNLSQGPEMRDWRIGGIDVASAMQDNRILHTEFRDDRFVAAVELGQGTVDVFYLLRVVSPGRYVVPAPTAEAMYRPELRGVGPNWIDVEVRDRESRRN